MLQSCIFIFHQTPFAFLTGTYLYAPHFPAPHIQK